MSPWNVRSRLEGLRPTIRFNNLLASSVVISRRSGPVDFIDANR
jgi:hypothetical protein